MCNEKQECHNMVERLNRIIRRKDLHLFVGLKPTQIDDAMAAGTFPRPVPLGGRAVGWLESELIEWQQKRVALRDDKDFMRQRLRRVTPPGGNTKAKGK
jgi:prophage regulatory protein